MMIFFGEYGNNIESMLESPAIIFLTVSINNPAHNHHKKPSSSPYCTHNKISNLCRK